MPTGRNDAQKGKVAPRYSKLSQDYNNQLEYKEN